MSVFAPTPPNPTGREDGPPADPSDLPAAGSLKLAEMSADDVRGLPDETLELIAQTIILMEIRLARSPQGLDTRLKLYRQVWTGMEERRPDLLARIKAKARRKRSDEGWPQPGVANENKATATPPPANDNPAPALTPPPANNTPAHAAGMLQPEQLTDRDFDAMADSDLQYLAAFAKHVLFGSARSGNDLSEIYDRYRILFCAIDRRWPALFADLAQQAQTIRMKGTA